MAVTTISRLSCDWCSIVVKGRPGERPMDLRDRAAGAGWRRIYGMPEGRVDACQVCAPKVAA